MGFPSSFQPQGFNFNPAGVANSQCNHPFLEWMKLSLTSSDVLCVDKNLDFQRTITGENEATSERHHIAKHDGDMEINCLWECKINERWVLSWMALKIEDGTENWGYIFYSGLDNDIFNCWHLNDIKMIANAWILLILSRKPAIYLP